MPVLVPLCLKYVKEGQEEKAFFHYGGDPRKYDDAVHVRVAYQRNTVVPDCLENSLLDMTNKSRASNINTSKLDRIVEEVQDFVRSLKADVFQVCCGPSLDANAGESVSEGTNPGVGSSTGAGAGAIGILMRTNESGKLEFEVFRDEEKLRELIKYPEIPSTLSSIPTVNIKDLVRLHNIVFDVDLVTWNEEQYAFKRTTDPSGTLVELSALYYLRNCSAINPPIALIVNDSTPPKIRGFLTRYMPGGDLGDWLDRRLDMEKAGSKISIPWSTKLNWLISIARVLVAMHSAKIYNGDLKPDNVLLDGRGGVRMVDFGPAGPTEGWGAPEYFDAWYGYFAKVRRLGRGDGVNNDESGSQEAGSEDVAPPPTAGFDFEDTLTPAMDIYGFGGLMWAIGEERNSGLDVRVWRSSPLWYREIAESCLAFNPERRPSATGLLFRLLARRLLLMVSSERQ